MTIKTKNINYKNPFGGICIFANVFSNLFYTCLINIVFLIIIIMWINDTTLSVKPSNIKIIFYFYIANLITLTLNNNNIINDIKMQYETPTII